MEWGACSPEDGLCHRLVQGGNVWHLQPASAKGTHLSDQLAALQTDAARRLLDEPSLVLLWDSTQGFVVFRLPCSRTHPDWVGLTRSLGLSVGHSQVCPSCTIAPVHGIFLAADALRARQLDSIQHWMPAKPLCLNRCSIYAITLVVSRRWCLLPGKELLFVTRAIFIDCA